MNLAILFQDWGMLAIDILVPEPLVQPKNSRGEDSPGGRLPSYLASAGQRRLLYQQLFDVVGLSKLFDTEIIRRISVHL